MNHLIHVLHLEDNPRDAELVLQKLKSEGLSWNIVWVNGKEAFEAALDQRPFNLIVCDYNVPDYDGMSALRLALEKQPEVPVIVISGQLGEEEAVECLKAGATDYVLKHRLQRLGSAVTRAVREGEARQKLIQAEQALRESEGRFRQLAEQSSDGFWFYGVKPERVLYVSPAVAHLWGLPTPRLYADPTLRLASLHPEDRSRVAAAYAQWVSGKSPSFDMEYRVVRSDGSLCWVQDTGALMRDGAGEIVRASGIARDITQRKQHEEKIAGLSRIHALLSGINSLIVRTRDRQQLFEETCRIAVEQGGFTLAWIGLSSPGASKVTPVAWMGADQGYLTEVGQALMNVIEDPGAGGRALREKRAIIANDIEHDPAVVFRDEALKRGFRSMAVFPLMDGAEPAGVFALYAPVPGFFDGEEMRLLTELSGDISFALGHIRKQEQLDYLAYFDALTGLPNRSLFLKQCDALLRVAADERKSLALILVDLERFRHVNETLGRHTGDILLQRVAERLKAILPASAGIARINADSFAFTASGIHGEADAARLFDEEITSAVKAPLEFGGNEYRVAMKAGIAVAPADGEDAETLLQNAEAALKRAKRSGERRLFYKLEMNFRAAQRLSLESKLRLALESEQFVLHYQPKFDTESMVISGLEALLRWADPAAGLVAPAEFIPVLEETGMILEVGRWAIERALSDYQTWLGEDLAPPRIAVNVSAIQLRQKNFAETVRNVIESSTARRAQEGQQDCALDLEITESLVMEDIDGNIAKLEAIREMGVRIYVDDFGTGYSSLSYIARLPINALKIDRAFVHNMMASPVDTTIVKTIISLAHALGLSVVAEGVETAEQHTRLSLLRCNEVQGYLFSRPVPVDRVAAMLSASGRSS